MDLDQPREASAHYIPNQPETKPKSKLCSTTDTTRSATDLAHSPQARRLYSVLKYTYFQPW